MQIETDWPDVTVIIPVFHDNDQLRRCLEHLRAQDYPGRARIVVVDNAAQPETAPVAAEFAEATFLWEPRPGSYSARNRALETVETEYIAFTDCDCAPHPGWLRAGVARLRADPRLGLVGGDVRIKPMDGRQPTLFELYEMIMAFPQKSYVETQRFAATANMFTRRSVFDAVGPFNATLMSGGDADWGKRVAAAGFAQAFEAAAAVDHPARATRAEVLGKMRRTVGGERDRGASWSACAAFVARHVLPPRHRIRSVLRYHETPVPPIDRAKLIALCTALAWARGGYRLRLQLTGSSSARS